MLAKAGECIILPEGETPRKLEDSQAGIGATETRYPCQGRPFTERARRRRGGRRKKMEAEEGSDRGGLETDGSRDKSACCSSGRT